MRGVILAGGLGTRLSPLTNVCNKHLLPVYNKPMIYYPIETLVKAGISEIAVVVSGKRPGQFIEILKNGENFGLKNIVYLYQEGADRGIADALALTRNFANNSNIVVILGDNTTDSDISQEVTNFENQKGAKLFLKKVPNPQKYGVPIFQDNKIIEIVEKPKMPPSDYAVTGLYFYDTQIYDFIEKCTPSGRGELEITDCNNYYIKSNQCQFGILDGFWRDAGSFEGLFDANKYWHDKFSILEG